VTSGTKSKNKHVAKRRRVEKNTRQAGAGNIAPNSFAASYADLLAILERLPRLSHELRGLEQEPRAMSMAMAIKLKTGLTKVDFNELRAAAAAAVNVLDLFIRVSKASAEELGDQADLTS
jgi:hypothetical protein